MVSLHHILRFISLNGSFLSVHPQLPKLPSLPLLSCYNRLSLRLRFAFCIACALVWVNCKDIVGCGWWAVGGCKGFGVFRWQFPFMLALSILRQRC